MTGLYDYEWIESGVQIRTCGKRKQMATMRVFMSEGSQFIRIPREYRLPEEDLLVNRIGDTIMLTPVSKLKESFMEGLRMFPDDFMADGRPPQIDVERDEL